MGPSAPPVERHMSAPTMSLDQTHADDPASVLVDAFFLHAQRGAVAADIRDFSQVGAERPAEVAKSKGGATRGRA
jgi:hypothetical protein